MSLPVLPAGCKLLVEFRAGRILKEGTTAKPDTRKGLVRVLRVRDLLNLALPLADGSADASAGNSETTQDSADKAVAEMHTVHCSSNGKRGQCALFMVHLHVS